MRSSILHREDNFINDAVHNRQDNLDENNCICNYHKNSFKAKIEQPEFEYFNKQKPMTEMLYSNTSEK